MPLMWFGHARQRRGIARDMIRRADAARDARNFHDAALLYTEALRLVPERGDIHVQAGHMFKEAGDHDPAEAHYLRARELMPGDADLALQLGHFYRTGGRLAEAEQAYARAAELAPDWPVPAAELRALAEAGWRRATDDEAAAEAPAPAFAGARDDLAATDLAPEIAPRPHAELLFDHHETIELRRLGRRERTHWGIMPTLRGVEALRGFCVSAVPIVELQLLLNGQLVHRGAVKGGYELEHEGGNPELRKYVFNVWLDLSNFVPGRYEVEYRLIDTKPKARSRHEAIVIAAPLTEGEFPDCDGVLSGLDPTGPLDRQINARPSMVRPSHRALVMKELPRTVLIQRTDQLGDVVVSVPALRRLREILPGAKLVGLLSRANAELAGTLGLFDETIVIDFPDDPWERRRVMPLDEQEALRRRLALYKFDLAIDLAENESSRPLLALSGAPVLFGFPSGKMPSLDIEMAGFTHDRWNGHEIVPHTNKLMGLVEWLGAMLRRHSSVVRRADLSPDRLAAFGLLAGDRYVVLHDGARLKFSRWPHYAALADRLIGEAKVKVVMLTDDPGLREGLPETLAGSNHFQLIDRKLQFDDFDALLHWCNAFVGNDSGPKHIASLRGAPVVSLHMARNNWNEWGQENGGFIVSRRVPCAGCLIWHDPEECGKDYACITQIGADEVFRAVCRLL